MGKTSCTEPPRLLDQVRDRIRFRHYSIRIEQAYLGWIRRFILFHGKRYACEMGAPEVERFLSAPATEHNVAASTQNQALSVILFLYREGLGIERPWLDGVKRAKRPQRLPVVLTREETQSVLAHLQGRNSLMASLLYGAGLRLTECVRLRVKDIEFERRQMVEVGAVVDEAFVVDAEAAGALYFSEDQQGRIWRVIYTGD